MHPSFSSQGSLLAAAKPPLSQRGNPNFEVFPAIVSDRVPSPWVSVPSVEMRAQGKRADTQRGVGRNMPELESSGVISGHLSLLVAGDPLSEN